MELQLSDLQHRFNALYDDPMLLDRYLCIKHRILTNEKIINEFIIFNEMDTSKQKIQFTTDEMTEEDFANCIKYFNGLL